MQKLIDAERSDIFDVLEYVAYAVTPVTREERAERARRRIQEQMAQAQREFISFVLDKYVHSGVDELDPDKLSTLLEVSSIHDGIEALGDVNTIRSAFIGFQKHLYRKENA